MELDKDTIRKLIDKDLPKYKSKITTIWSLNTIHSSL